MATINYDTRVTLRKLTGVRDSFGQIRKEWVNVAQPWANRRVASGAETIRSGAMDVSTVRASFRIRWRAGIDAGMQLLHGTTVYEIVSVLADRRADRIDLVCEVINPKS